MYKDKFVSVVIAAAGMSNRMGSKVNKQFILVGGKPILAHTIEKFEACDMVDEIVIAGKESEIDYINREIVKKYGLKKVSAIVRGGVERHHSVYNALLSLSEKSDIVLSHDGARPFVDIDTIERDIKAVYKTGAAIVGVPVKDTIKVVENYEVEDTPTREKLWQAQTPQGFDKNLLLEAYRDFMKKDLRATDDAGIVEAYGKRVVMVRGSYENIKITTPDDVILGEALMMYKEGSLPYREMSV
ncbi:MAG: 2-C-methyl-D-erythritol 4-phosphate cytidylyltransferase [Tissierellia bacterium]|nr:2-C-methyl-D-erythritol 4-phosphate cytidylyltransferase [Tissierellia bacterium]